MFLNYKQMAKLFENLQGFIPDRANEYLPEALVKAVDVFQQQKKRKNAVSSLIWESFNFIYAII